MDLCPATFKSFAVQWSVKIASRQAQLKPLAIINDLPDNVTCNIATYADDTTLYSKCEQASDQ